MLIEREEADRIARYLDLHAPPRRADLAFVFGTRLPEPANLAANLFGRDLVEYVVLTGAGKARFPSSDMESLPERCFLPGQHGRKLGFA